MIKYFLLISLFCTHLVAIEGLTFSSDKVKNGESLLALFTGDESLVAKNISYDKKVYPFYKINFSDHDYYALVPFHYNEKLGFKSLSFEYSNENKTYIESNISIELIWGGYRKEMLKVNSSKIKLSKRDKKRSQKEYASAMRLYAKKSPRLLPMNVLQQPLSTFITSAFGNERLFNGVRKSYHSGVDFRAKTGVKIKPMGFGKVVLVGDRFYAGLSIVVDHGHGIYSGYYHMSKSYVAIGDIVDENDILGLSGASGRITGPHLHFSMKVHGITVNPLQLIELLNRVL